MQALTRCSLSAAPLVLALQLAPAGFGRQADTESALLPEPFPQAQFGRDVEIAGPWAFVGDIATDAVWFFRRDTDGWKPAGGDRGPTFSWFGDSMSSDGETLVVGGFAYGWPQNVIGFARVYELVDDRWKRTQDLTPPQFMVVGPNPQDMNPIFGDAVAVDGEVMVIGAPGHDLPVEKAGMILIYERSDGVWRRVAEFGQETLNGPSGFLGQHTALGVKVAVAGNTIAATTSGERGAVFVFEREEGTWRRSAMLFEMNPPDAGHDFGESIALSEDGCTLVVGQADPGGTSGNYGRAHVYERLPWGWVRNAVLHASPGSGHGDRFGASVDIDENLIVVGAFDAEGNPSIWGQEGAAFFFERDSTGQWPATESRRWYASDAQNTTHDFAAAVAIDGGFAVVASHDRAAHVFEVGVGTLLCSSLQNSTGVRGRLTVVPSPPDEASFTLSARDCPPDRPGAFLASLSTGQVVLGNGVLCLGSPIVRLRDLSPTGPTGTAFHPLDAADPRFGFAFGPGTTFHVQYWFSDTVGAGANLTNAVSVTLQ